MNDARGWIVEYEPEAPLRPIGRRACDASEIQNYPPDGDAGSVFVEKVLQRLLNQPEHPTA